MYILHICVGIGIVFFREMVFYVNNRYMYVRMRFTLKYKNYNIIYFTLHFQLELLEFIPADKFTDIASPILTVMCLK